jgi:hypothetical protein
MLFAKAMSDALTPGGADLYRRERDILGQLPRTVPTAALLAAHDDGEWIVLVYEHVEGRNPVPSRPDDLAAMLQTYSELAATLTPAPIALGHVRDDFGRWFDNWTRLRAAGREHTIAEYGWAAENLDLLTDTARNWRDAVEGDTLLHGDLRADNMVLTTSGIIVVDWPEAVIGPAWLDLLLALPSMGMFAGGPDPERVVLEHPLTRAVDPEMIDSVVAAIAGFFTCESVLPPPSGLPTLRKFQRDQAIVALDWARRRLDR